MNNIEKELNEKRKELENIEIPEELESRLRQSLDGVQSNRKRFNYKGLIAAAAIAIFLIGYNADAIAYYGKRLLGYDDMMNDTLKELNKLEKGQIVDKSYEFKDGTKFTLDAIMLDDNNLVVFYNIYDSEGIGLNLFNNSGSVTLEGYKNIDRGSGQGQISEDGKSMNWIMTYDTPGFYEKNMKLTFKSPSTGEKGQIQFQLNRNKAVGKSLNVNINKKVELSERNILIKSLVASPITTRIEGELENIVELGIDQIQGERIYYESIELELLADGKKIDVKSSEMSTNLKGSHFNISFDRLPQNTKEIVIKLKSFGANETVKQKFDLDKGKLNKTINILDEDMIINEVYEEKGNTYINLTTEENMYLSSFHLNIDGKEVNQEQTIEVEGEKIDKTEKEKLMFFRTRTIEFKGTAENLELNIERIRYLKDYDKVIYTEKVK